MPVSPFSGRKANAQIYTVSGKSASRGSVWPAGDLQSAKCQSVFRKPWNTGTAGCSGGGSSPLVETADAAVYRRRNHPLYDFGADGLLKQMQNRECCG